jgi:small subunit ribosomal protein S14
MARDALVISWQNRQAEHAKARAAGKRPKFITRAYNRCTLCKRRGGYMRFFKLCRICFRELACNGDIPGITKSSW